MKGIFFLILLLFTIIPIFSDSIPIKGDIFVENSMFQASFELFKKAGGEYTMVIRPKLSQSPCYFWVKKISAPQQLRGRSGIIHTNKPSNCIFSVREQESQSFWNSIILVDFEYSFSMENTLNGKATLSALEKTIQPVFLFIK